MSKEFDKRLFFSNVVFLIKKQHKRIGEVETAAGVSAGYISRSSKEAGTKPGIDFVVKVADILDTSVDTLIGVNLVGLSPTEQYLISFLEKLVRDTNALKLDWNLEESQSLNQIDDCSMVSHPMFFDPFNGNEIGVQGRRAGFMSHTFGLDTVISGPCFNLRLKNYSYLYLMDYQRDTYDESRPFGERSKEIWFCKTGEPNQFLCSSFEHQNLTDCIESLFMTIVEYFEHPQLRQSVRNVIDAFMKDDLGDDFSNTDLPF